MSKVKVHPLQKVDVRLQGLQLLLLLGKSDISSLEAL